MSVLNECFCHILKTLRYNEIMLEGIFEITINLLYQLCFCRGVLVDVVITFIFFRGNQKP